MPVQSTAAPRPGPGGSPGSVTGSRRGRPPAATPQELQRAAVAVLAEHGYAAMSVDDLAAELGIGRTTFFRYFGSKPGVVWWDYEDALDRLPGMLESAELPLTQAIVDSVLHMQHLGDADREFMNRRYALISATPELDHERARTTYKFVATIADFVHDHAGTQVHVVIPVAFGYALIGVQAVVTRMWAESAGGVSFIDMLRPALETIAITFEPTIKKGTLGLES